MIYFMGEMSDRHAFVPFYGMRYYKLFLAAEGSVQPFLDAISEIEKASPHS